MSGPHRTCGWIEATISAFTWSIPVPWWMLSSRSSSATTCGPASADRACAPPATATTSEPTHPGIGYENHGSDVENVRYAESSIAEGTGRREALVEKGDEVRQCGRTDPSNRDHAGVA